MVVSFKVRFKDYIGVVKDYQSTFTFQIANNCLASFENGEQVQQDLTKSPLLLAVYEKEDNFDVASYAKHVNLI